MVRLRLLLPLVFVLLCGPAFSQPVLLVEDFSDSNFTANPVWAGTDWLWKVDTTTLRLNVNSDSTRTTWYQYLTTPFLVSALDSASWEFDVRIASAIGSPNQAEIFLTSDTDDLNYDANVRGYYIRFNGSNQNISLYRKNGTGSGTLIIEGTDEVTDTVSQSFRIRVTRNDQGYWRLFWDSTSTGNNYIEEIDAGHNPVNTDETTSAYFGVRERHNNTSRKNWFFIDNINVQHFPSPDLSPPSILSVTASDSNQLEVLFDEYLDPISAGTETNYDAGGQTPSLATATGALVILDFNSAFANCQTEMLMVENVTDTSTNGPNVMLPDTLPYIYCVTIPAGPRDVVINEIGADPNDLCSYPDIEYIELYNRGGFPVNLKNWTFADSNSSPIVITSTNYILPAGGYVILTNDTTWPGNVPFIKMSLPNLNNDRDRFGLRNDSFILIDSMDFHESMYTAGSTKDYSLELINPEIPCLGVANWASSTDPCQATPGRENSVFDLTYLTQGPSIASVVVADTNMLTVCFDVPYDSLSASMAGNYSVANLGQATSAQVILPEFECVNLEFPFNFNSSVTYSLVVRGLENCNGTSANDSIDFLLGGPAVPFQVVINEIYADQTPELVPPAWNLPKIDFLELYNNGPNAVELEGWTLKKIDNSVTTDPFPAYVLDSGGYVIVCDESKLDSFPGISNIIGVDDFITINNEDELELFNSSNSLMDLVYYDKNFYQDNEKEEGGWTLERIDPTFACLNGDNWHASMDSTGGTPGRENSVRDSFKDEVDPILISASPTPDGFILHVKFNEILDEGSLLDRANYSISPLVNIMGIISDGPTSKEADIFLAPGLNPRIKYCLTVTGVKDCYGNEVAETEICFGLPEPIDDGDLVLNEILFDPETGGDRFLEFYNLSDKILDLSTLYISKRDSASGPLVDTVAVAEEELLLFPQSYICTTTDRVVTLAKYQPIDPAAVVEVDKIPAFKSNEDFCVLWVDSAGSNDIIDELHYLDDWHFANLDDKEGVSLERIDFLRATQDEHNWHSAASTVNYGTPGYRNSQVLVPSSPDSVWLQPVTFSPDGDGFNDHLSINYRFTQPGWNLKATVFDNKGRLIKVVQENTLPGTEDKEGTLKWGGTDEYGKKAAMGIYVVLVEAVHPATGKTSVFKLGCVLAARLSAR